MLVQARLGNPVAYTGNYPLYVTAGQYNVDPTVDPAKTNPITSGWWLVPARCVAIPNLKLCAGHMRRQR